MTYRQARERKYPCCDHCSLPTGMGHATPCRYCQELQTTPRPATIESTTTSSEEDDMSKAIKPEDIRVGDTIKVTDEFTITSTDGNFFRYTDSTGENQAFVLTAESKVKLIKRETSIPADVDLILVRGTEGSGFSFFFERAKDGSKRWYRDGNDMWITESEVLEEIQDARGTYIPLTKGEEVTL